jgi:muramidase (phage lysozyme)
MAGDFVKAIDKVRTTWASLPGSGCHQPEHSLPEVEKWYEDAGGTFLQAA